MTRRQRLAARGASASAVATLLAAVSHTLGGGAAPAPTIVLGMLVLLIGPAALLMGSHPRLPRIAATTAAAQAAFHGVFAMLGAPHAGSVVDGGHRHGVPISVAPTTAGSDDAPMLAAHVVAALVTIAILGYGERAIRHGTSWVRAAARALVPDGSFPTVPRVLALPAPRIRRLTRVVAANGVRGPPLFS
ncbi:hypothetical protein [Microbacterium suaedae]|uniref:hypothetical protein n=1 Tax=Microbacterium suaedae TaxID=2067813 RepID=UPI0013A6547B|nr:hypothetical protein [Microbacterium suaedae]